METTPLERIGTKLTDTFTITLDHDHSEYCVFPVEYEKYGTDNLKVGSVWVVRGRDYNYDEQKNYVVLRRVDSGI